MPLELVIKQSANLGGLITGMHNGDFDLIKRSLVDHVIEPQRKHLIPHFDAIKDASLAHGALGCSLSGSGPAIFALCQEKTQADEIAVMWESIYSDKKLDSMSWAVGVNYEGVIVK